MSSPNASLSIAFVMDPRLPRERAALLVRTVNQLRSLGQIQVFSGDIEEKELIHELEAKSYNLVLVPWYHYLKWSRVEAALGLTRTSGTAFAGYFCDELHPSALGEGSDYLRHILLDFSAMTPIEIMRIVRSLIYENRRSGIQPLLQSGASIYCDPWYRGETLGSRIDAVFGLPELAEDGWAKRSNAVRGILSSLWSMIYDEGFGKKEMSGPGAVRAPVAYFQIGIDGQTLVFRLCYSAPLKTPKSALALFWPDAKRPAAAPQLLLRHSDFVRVHTIAESSDIELVVCLFQSAPSERSATGMHTLWVEPLAQDLVSENPAVGPNPGDPRLKQLPLPSGDPQRARTTLSGSKPASQRTYTVVELSEVGGEAMAMLRDESSLTESTKRVAELTQELASRDTLIAELRSGGVGLKAAAPAKSGPLDFDQVIHAFQERYFDTRFQIRQLEVQISELTLRNDDPEELGDLKIRLDALLSREQDWIKKITSTIELFHKSQKTKNAG